MHKLLVASLLCFALCSAQTAPSTCLTSLQALKPLAEEFFTHFTNDDFDFFPLAMQMANPQIQEVSEKCFGSSLPSLDSESCTLGLKDLVPVLAALKLDAQNMNFFQLAMNLDDNSEVIEGSSAACGLPVDFSLMTAQRCTDSLEILSPLVEVIVNSFYSADFDQLASSIADALEPIEEASAACTGSQFGLADSLSFMAQVPKENTQECLLKGVSTLTQIQFPTDLTLTSFSLFVDNLSNQINDVYAVCYEPSSVSSAKPFNLGPQLSLDNRSLRSLTSDDISAECLFAMKVALPVLLSMLNAAQYNFDTTLQNEATYNVDVLGDASNTCTSSLRARLLSPDSSIECARSVSEVGYGLVSFAQDLRRDGFNELAALDTAIVVASIQEALIKC